MHFALFVHYSIFPLHVIYMSKDIAKLAMIESHKEAFVCTTHLWNLNKRRERLRRRNQRDRDRHAAESAQQREAWLNETESKR